MPEFELQTCCTQGSALTTHIWPSNRFITINSLNIVSDVLGTVDFIQEKDNRPMFQTCKKEKNQVVFQLVS